MRIGHCHIKVRNIEISKRFYEDVLGVVVTEEVPGSFVFLSGTAMHHEIALQRVGANAKSPGRNDVGLFHTAFEVNDKKEFAEALQRVLNLQIPVFTVDHRISWAMYFSDPDGNGMEIYCDTREERGIKRWDGLDEPLAIEDILQTIR